MKFYAFPCGLALLLATPALATAQVGTSEQASDAERSVARQLTVSGLEALDKKDFAAAETAFARAVTIFWAPTIGLGLARARAGLGKLVSAQEAYSRVAHTTVTPDASAAFKEAIASARRELDLLSPRVPTVAITVTGASAPEVTVDTDVVSAATLGFPRPADPGRHVIRARAHGYLPAEVTVTLTEQMHEKVSLVLKLDPNAPNAMETGPAPVNPPAAEPTVPQAATPQGWTSQRRAAVVTGGAGVVGLVIGGVFGGMAASLKGNLSSECPNNVCFTQQAKNDHASANSDALIATIAIPVGAAAVAAGVGLYLLSGGKSSKQDDAAKTAHVVPMLGPQGGGLSLVGMF
jgi:hypothetical protein